MNSRSKNGSPEAGQAILASPRACLPVAIPPQDIGSKTEDQVLPDSKRPALKAVPKNGAISRDMLYLIQLDGACHIISEDYSYKSDTYYSILRQEMDGRTIRPSSATVLDAYVVPVCLERAHLAGIPVCEWGISQGYAPLPSIVYGLNYFASTADFFVVHDSEKSKEVIKHITNKGKYPFCFQKLNDGAEIQSMVSIFGKTADDDTGISALARQVYDLFKIPLVTIVFVQYEGRCLLSSLAPTRYSRLSSAERTLLAAYLSHQEFL